jgi:uncharacterized protein YrrD
VRKGKSIVGKDVLSLADGTRVETVSDVVIDPDGLRMVALVVDEGGFLSSSKAVPIDRVESFGKDAVVIADQRSVVSVADRAELKNLVERDDRLVGKKVFTVAGDKLGSISDIYFDESNGTIVGYEVSSGTLGDVAKGASYLPSDEITNIGPDVIYVEPETAGSLEAQVGGAQGALEGARDKLGRAGAAAGQKLGEARDDAGQRAADTRPEDRLVGKRTGRDVEGANGSVLIPAGRRVRPEDVSLAQRDGLLRELTASVALGESQAAGEDAKDALGTAGDRAGSLWDQFTRKLSEVTDATGARVDEQKTRSRLAEIEDAIGRPVTKVILDRQDEVILNLGDIITHQAIQRAHEAGGLDSLLASVYKGGVEFSKEEMRAPVDSTASVEKSSGGAVIVEELERKVDDAERTRQAERDRQQAQAEADRQQRERERDSRRLERETAKRSREEADPTGQGTGRAQPMDRQAGRGR